MRARSRCTVARPRPRARADRTDDEKHRPIHPGGAKCLGHPRQPGVVFEVAGDASMKAAIDWLYSVTVMLAGGREVKRIHSTTSDVISVGGRKPVLPNAYTDRKQDERSLSLPRRDRICAAAPGSRDHTGSSTGLCDEPTARIRRDAARHRQSAGSQRAYDESDVAPIITIARQTLPALRTQSI